MENIKRQNVAFLHFTLFLILALAWSGSFINIKIVVNVLPPVFSAMIRVLISLICLSTFFIITKKVIYIRSFSLWRIWVAGIFSQFLPFALLFYGEKFIAPGLASVINSTVSLWALLLGALLYRDLAQISPLKILGLILGFAGIVIIFKPYFHKGESSLIGIAALICMAASYGVGSVISQHVIFNKMRVTFETNLIQQHLSSIVFLIATSLYFETWPSWTFVFNLHILFAFLYLGIVATAIAWVIYFYLIREWGAVRATTVMYVVPVLAIIWDFVFLHLVPGQNELIGALAILMGVTLIQWVRKPKRRAIEEDVEEKSAQEAKMH